MRKKTHHRHYARTTGQGGARLNMITLLLLLSLLASWAGSAPVTLASGQANACEQGCAPAFDPPDFDLDVAPVSQTAEQGETATYMVSINTINCYTGTVTLSLAGLPGATAYAFDPAATPPPTDSTLTIATSADTPPGDYTLVVSGDSGDLHHEASVNLIVTAPPPPEPFFSIAVSPENQPVNAGDAAVYSVSLSMREGYSGTVSLPVALSVADLPDGAQATLNPDALVPPGNSVLTISTAAHTPAGTFELTINGDSGDLHDEVNATLVVNIPPPPEPFFSIAVSPESQPVNAGDAAAYSVSLSMREGYSGTVSLPVALSVTGLPGGAEFAFDPTTLLPPGDSVLTISTTVDTPVGAYELTINGDSGDLHDEVNASLVVNTQQTLVSVYPPTADLFIGQTTETQILLNNAHDFYGAEFFMSYDPSVVQVVDANPGLEGVQIALGELFPSGQNTIGINIVDAEAGLISFAVARLAPLEPVDGGGELAVISWEAVGEGHSDLSFTHLKLASPSGVELDAISQDGAISTTLTGELGGVVHMQGRLEHSGAEVTLSPLSLQAITDIQGLFHFMAHGVLTVTARMYGYLDAQATVEVASGGSVDLGPTTLYGGEVVQDGLIDILDLAYLGARFHTDDLSADINGDGVVDILDLVLAAANFMMSGPTAWSE